jgi:hypothetical protein
MLEFWTLRSRLAGIWFGNFDSFGINSVFGWNSSFPNQSIRFGCDLALEIWWRTTSDDCLGTLDLLDPKASPFKPLDLSTQTIPKSS